MPRVNDVGIGRQANGIWYYRISVVVDGKKVNQRKTVDLDGNQLLSKTAAAKAREAAIQKAKEDQFRKRKITPKTFSEVYSEYCKNGRSQKAQETIRKQDSLWNNHLKQEFGDRLVDDVSPAEIQDYLSTLYYKQDYSYQYTESFLKMFYLIFGQAYTRNFLDIDTYSRLCINKGTKITMPPLKVDDDIDIKSFSQKELEQLDEYFKGTTAETAYYLGRYCGLRINEAYGLKWNNINFEENTITIDRQMSYHNGIIRLSPVKTRNSNRTIFMNEKTKSYLLKVLNDKTAHSEEMKPYIAQNCVMIEDIDRQMIPCTELVNTLPNGKIRTVNSMKFHTKKIASELGITFKYHYLRHTFGTLMAEMNTPEHLLLKQMGHSKIETTKKYYLALSSTGIDILQDNMNKL